MSVQEYFSGFRALCTEYTILLMHMSLMALLAGIWEIYKITRGDQFLMKLRSELENVRSNLKSRHPSPSLETCQEQREVTRRHLSDQRLLVVLLKLPV